MPDTFVKKASTFAIRMEPTTKVREGCAHPAIIVPQEQVFPNDVPKEDTQRDPMPIGQKALTAIFATMGNIVRSKD